MDGLPVYAAGWSATIAAVLILLKRLARAATRSYLYFLLVPWKAVTFLIAMSGITLAAPFSGDPTWDYLDSVVISVSVFVCSPWAVGCLFLFFKGRRSWADLYVAVVLMLFSSSWFYDGYILLRD